MARIWKIDVPGRYGYSFAVKCYADDEEDAIDLAAEHGCYDDNNDALYATAEDITNSPYDLNAFKDCIQDLTNNE